MKIEDTINNVLGGETRKNALDFATFLEANEMTVAGAEVTHKGKTVCYMHIDGSEQVPGPWTIWTEGDYSSEDESIPLDECTKAIAHAHANICGHFTSGGKACGCGSQPGTRKTIFGKEFDNVCNADMMFTDPDAETLECIKKLLLMRKCGIDSEKSNEQKE